MVHFCNESRKMMLHGHHDGIDGAVYVKGTNLTPGTFLPVQIEARQDYDLVGSAVAVEVIEN